MRRGLAWGVALLVFLGVFAVIRTQETLLISHVLQLLPISIVAYLSGYWGGIFAGLVVSLFVVIDIFFRYDDIIFVANQSSLPIFLMLYPTYGFVAGLIFHNMHEKNRLLGRLGALHHAISILHTTDDMDEFYESTVRLVTTDLGYLNAAIYVEDNGDMVLREAARYAPGAEKGSSILCTKGYCTNSMKTGKSVIVSRKKDMDLCFLSSEETMAQIIVPLKLYERNMGVLVIESGRESMINKEELAILEAFGQQIVVAMEKAQLFAETKELLAEARVLAETDGLTRLYNHRYFKQALAEEIKRVKRMGGFVSVIIMDIDDFKQINDSYGHTVGDEVLVRIASVIKESLREIDVVARYGGEEFAVILPGSNKEAALQAAERLRSIIGESDFILSDSLWCVTMSMGLATYPTETEDWSSLIVLADKRLYEAKRLGKNRVVD